MPQYAGHPEWAWFDAFAGPVHGALEKYDLPDLLRTLPEDKIKVIEPTNAAGLVLDWNKVGGPNE